MCFAAHSPQMARLGFFSLLICRDWEVGIKLTSAQLHFFEKPYLLYSGQLNYFALMGPLVKVYSGEKHQQHLKPNFDQQHTKILSRLDK